MRRTYTQEQKQQALDLYVLHGPCRASKETGIPKQTIQQWAKKAGLESKATQQTEAATKAQEVKNAQRRARIKNKLLDRAEEMLDRMGESMKVWVGSGASPVEVVVEKPPASVCKDLALTFAVVIDKFRLENGEVTGREEVVTVDAVDQEIQRLTRELATRPTVDARTAEAN